VANVSPPNHGRAPVDAGRIRGILRIGTSGCAGAAVVAPGRCPARRIRGFGGRHAELVRFTPAYTLVISALLERKDFIPAQALPHPWLGQAESGRVAKRRVHCPRLADTVVVAKLREHLRRSPANYGRGETSFLPIYLEATRNLPGSGT